MGAYKTVRTDKDLIYAPFITLLGQKSILQYVFRENYFIWDIGD